MKVVHYLSLVVINDEPNYTALITKEPIVNTKHLPAVLASRSFPKELIGDDLQLAADRWGREWCDTWAKTINGILA